MAGKAFAPHPWKPVNYFRASTNRETSDRNRGETDRQGLGQLFRHRRGRSCAEDRCRSLQIAISGQNRRGQKIAWKKSSALIVAPSKIFPCSSA